MAKLLMGINGPFSGKVGTVVGYVWKGIPVMRAVPKPRKGEPSFLQKQQHARFAMMHKFLGELVPLLNVTYGTIAVHMTGYNKAFSYNVKNAISGIHPEQIIDYTMVLIGRGDLPNISSPVIESTEGEKITFKWFDNSGTGKARPTDKVFLAIYNQELNDWTYIMNGSQRKAGTHTMDVSTFAGKPVHAYIGFITEDGKDVSDSVYAGVVQILESPKIELDTINADTATPVLGSSQC